MLKVLGSLSKGERLLRIKKSPQYRDGSFKNLSDTPNFAPGIGVIDVLKAQGKKPKTVIPDIKIPSVQTNLKTLSAENPAIVWFGHSSYFIATGNLRMLVDPVFSGFASPVTFFGKNFEGSNSYSADDFPDLDVILLTHDHYDHLDYKTILQLKNKTKHFIAPIGVAAHLILWGVDENRITELDWWESTTVINDIKLTSTPARHFSGRSLKRNQSLWSSYVLETPTHCLYLGGDSGYDTHFKSIGEKFKGFDLAILECGQYNAYWPYIHMTPEETAQAALDLNAKVLMPVHWGKFTLALHPWNEPIERVLSKAQQLNIPTTTPHIGEPVFVGKEYPKTKWWEKGSV